MKRTAYAALTGTVVLLAGCSAVEQVAQRAAPATTTTPTPTSTPTPVASTSATPTPTATKPLAKSHSTYWPASKQGMCLILPDDPYKVTRTDCRAKHHAEVTLRSRLRGGAWPGDDALDEQASKVCEAAFPRYVGLALDESLLDYDYITADRAGWEDGNRTLICLVVDPSQEWTTRALKGSRE